MTISVHKRFSGPFFAGTAKHTHIGKTTSQNRLIFAQKNFAIPKKSLYTMLNILYNVVITKEKPKPKGEPEMKMAEFIESTKQVEAQYANKTVGLYDLRSDILDAIEEGYIDDITVDNPQKDNMTVCCEDGTVIVSKKDGKLEYKCYEPAVYKRFY